MELKFNEFFVNPIGDRGLTFTEKLRRFDGNRVRILGYMVRQGKPTPGAFLLAPVPVQLDEDHYGLADDLPAATLYVSVPDHREQIIPFTARPMLLTGTLSIGNREEPDGRISTVLSAVAYGDKRFVVGGESGTIVTSHNGTIWTKQNSGSTGYPYAMAYGQGKFVAVGDAIRTSSNGTAWTKQTVGFQPNLNGIAYGNGLFVAVGCGRTILNSVDGNTWIQATQETGCHLESVAWGNGTFVAVGPNKTILTSRDGVTWKKQCRETGVDLESVAYAEGLFVAVGDGIFVSPDGVQWTNQPLDSPMSVARTHPASATAKLPKDF